MCGRFANSDKPDVQAAYYIAKLTAKGWLPPGFARRGAEPSAAGQDGPSDPGIAGWHPTWNAAPTQPLPVVLPDGGARALTLMRWGWRRDFTRGDDTAAAGGAREGQLLVNARGEEAAGKRTWREALRTRRCLVPATAFYEWKEASRQPWAFTRSDRGPFAIAGLWEPDGEGGAFILLTTVANAVVAPVHHRMACIVPREAHDAWLDPQTPAAAVAALIAPYPATAMRAWPVGTAVNRVANDGARLLDEAAPAPEQLRIDGLG